MFAGSWVVCVWKIKLATASGAFNAQIWGEICICLLDFYFVQGKCAKENNVIFRC